ncbi:cholinesterase 2 [Bombyx mori]|uniref:Carboxylic ester hydrolase n=1 Tax=Bombyx mori TaxID=7091 RepID=A0A8R2R9J0_BOMMO|nr:cholinesterase 2 [Bombyx mori]
MLRPVTLAVVVVALLSAAGARLRVDPLVETRKGLIKGLRSENGEFSKFLGVPYALVDEDNPFGSSVPHPGFEEIFEAFDDSVVCPQLTDNVAVGSLQCLNLNIYVPNTATSRNKRPVMIWIHGGGFMSGSGTSRDYSFEDLVRHDVIIVSVNYRLGAFGFFCLDSADVPGNQGLKDQVLALKWIKENIEAFGGDTSKITLFGESAGGVAVELHLLTEQEKFFNRAIIQSGSVFIPGAITKPDNSIPIRMASRLGFETDNFVEAIAFLADQDPLLVVEATKSDGPVTLTDATFGSFTACIENEYNGVYRFLANAPENIDPKKLRNIPVIYGVNDHEMLILHAFISPEQYEQPAIRNYMKIAFDLKENEIEEDVTHFYIADEPFNPEVFDKFINFASNYLFNYPVERSLKKILSAGNEDIYYYVFSYDGGRNVMKKHLGITAPGAAHADELGYLLAVDLQPGELVAEEDQLVIDRITTLWTNFAKFGNPTPETSDLLPVVWSPVTASRRPFLEIGADFGLKSRPFHDRMAFWDLFYKLYGKLERIH